MYDRLRFRLPVVLVGRANWLQYIQNVVRNFEIVVINVARVSVDEYEMFVLQRLPLKNDRILDNFINALI